MFQPPQQGPEPEASLSQNQSLVDIINTWWIRLKEGKKKKQVNVVWFLVDFESEKIFKWLRWPYCDNWQTLDMVTRRDQHHMTVVIFERALVFSKHMKCKNAASNYDTGKLFSMLLKVILLYCIITMFMTRGVCMCRGTNVEVALLVWTILLSFHCGIQESNSGFWASTFTHFTILPALKCFFLIKKWDTDTHMCNTHM